MIGKLFGPRKIDATSRYAHLAQDSIEASSARAAYCIGSDTIHRAQRETKPV